MENRTFREVDNIARIFDVKEKGNELIESIQNTVGELQSQIGEVQEPLKVFYMSGGEEGSASTTGGDTIYTHVIELVGGENIFDELKGSVVDVSWEEVVERDPDVIVFGYCCGTTPEQLMDAISDMPSLQNITAVQNEHYVTIEHADVDQSVRIPTGLETLAKGFYPERFNEFNILK